MSETETMEKTTIDGFLDDLVAAGVAGGEMAIGHSAAETLADAIEGLMGDSFPAALNLPGLRQFKPVIVAAAVLLACKIWGSKIPAREQVERYSRRALQASAYEIVNPYLKPLFEALQGLGASLPEAQA